LEKGCVLTFCAGAEFVLLQTFVDAAILAYECGMNEDSLRHELKVYKASLEQQVAPPGMVSHPAAQHSHAPACSCAIPTMCYAQQLRMPAQWQHCAFTASLAVCILQAVERSSWVLAQIGRCVIPPQRSC
jgi:hypothetical protein